VNSGDAAMSTAATPALDIAFEERHPDSPDVVVLLHGFPDDGRTWDAVLACPELARSRTIVPWLRGYGATTFRDPLAPRTAQASALARDVLDLLDALGIARCTLVGHDWGARAAYGAAVLAPERFSRIVAMSVGYGTNVAAQKMSYGQAAHYWYQWLFATSRGEAALRDDRRGLCRYLWQTWSPSWNFTENDFERTAKAFDNPDFVEVVLHSYRSRWGFAPADPRYAADDAALAKTPPVRVPTIVLHGDEDGATLLESSAGVEAYFPAGYAREVLSGVGHFVQRERPAAVAAAIARVL
jgi:pimeloyl-ACP methyl ester carboxylesterase